MLHDRPAHEALSAASQSIPGRQLLMLALGALLLFAATLCLDTRQNRFPFFYHSDEPDKVGQLITGRWNFHHPLLMLGTAETAKRVLGLPDRAQTLVELGRWCSAAFAAGGVLCFALLGWRARGWSAFWLVGLLLLTQHQVYELAHYFKEDTALFFAMALAFLALHMLDRRPGWGPALFAGAACGLCLSAKYLGVVMLIPAAVIMAGAQRGGRAGGIQWVWFACAFIAVAAAVNFPVFTQLALFRHSFGRETSLVAHGERGYTGGQVAIFDYLRIFVADTTPAVWVLILAEVLACWKKGGLFDRTMTIFPLAFMLLLSCSTKTNDRYFLPATAGFHYLAALGAVDLPTLLSGQWAALRKPWLLAAPALLLNLFYIPAGLVSYMISFAHDDRGEMLAWIHANIPPGAVIAGETKANLPIERRPERLAIEPLLPQRVIETRYMADLGPDPAALVAQGIGYIVISESDYGIFFRRAATNHLTPDMQRKRAFYEALRHDYQPVWERPRGTGIYLHPGLEVYRLKAE